MSRLKISFMSSHSQKLRMRNVTNCWRRDICRTIAFSLTFPVHNTLLIKRSKVASNLDMNLRLWLTTPLEKRSERSKENTKLFRGKFLRHQRFSNFLSLKKLTKIRLEPNRSFLQMQSLFVHLYQKSNTEWPVKNSCILSRFKWQPRQNKNNFRSWRPIKC